LYRNKNKKIRNEREKNYLANIVGIDSIDCCRFPLFLFHASSLEGHLFGGVGLFLTINLLIIAFFVNKNFKE